jgi:hypothetical protein
MNESFVQAKRFSARREKIQQKDFRNNELQVLLS